MTCQVTGDVSEDNFVLADGKIVLSKEGAQQLINEIEKKSKESKPHIKKGNIKYIKYFKFPFLFIRQYDTLRIHLFFSFFYLLLLV